jgi:multidrug efflux pump subunit AcrA (membrane-fusion protein)
MKKTFITVGIILAFIVLGYLGFRFFRARQQASTISTLQTVALSRGDLTATVGATGTVRADQTALVAWQTTGIVDHVYARVGQLVDAGEILADLSAASLPQNVILAQSDLVAAQDALSKLTNPDPATISNAEKALALAYTAYQQAQNNLTNAIIINKNSNDITLYKDWFTGKTSLEAARNQLPLANASIDIQAFYQSVRSTQQLQEDLAVEKTIASNHPEDELLAQKVADLEVALQESLAKQNGLQSGLAPGTANLVLNLSSNLSLYETATLNFISTVFTDTSDTSVDLARIQADLAQKQSDLINAQSSLDDLVNHRQTMSGKRCDDATIADYQKAYDAALNAYNFTGHIANSREYQLLQTAAANLNWCTAVWSETDIAAQDAKITSTQAQIQLLQAQIIADQNQITNMRNSVYGLAISLNNFWTTYQDASQQLSNAVTTLYELERAPNPDDLSAAQARLQAAQTIVGYQSVNAPFRGTITKVEVTAGDQVTPASIAFRLDNLARLFVDVLVSEVDVNSIQVGQPVSLAFDAILDRQYAGVVSQVAPVGDAIQGVVQFDVTVELTDPDENVKPGMTAAVNIVVDQVSNVLLVPNRAVRLVQGQRVVYILSNDQLRKVNVTLGASSDTESQVLQGDLQVGDKIVLNPPQDLFSASGGPFGP